MQIKNEYIVEYLKCKNDPVYFITHYCSDYTLPDKPIISNLYPKQLEILEKFLKDHRIILLGSRQVGKTVLIVFLCCWLLLFFPNYTIAVLSRKQEHTNMLVKEIRLALEALRPPFTIDFSNKEHVVKKIESYIELANGSNVIAISVPKENPEEAGRGLRAGFIFIDEAAHIVNLKRILSGLTYTTNRMFLRYEQASIPYGIVISSTPNRMTGVGEVFFRMWLGASNGTSNYVPVRFHWKDVPDYNDDWYKAATKNEDPREVAQELDLVFLGDELSFFPDDILIRLQQIEDVAPAEEVLVDGFPIILYEPRSTVNRDEIYVVGVDTATRTGDSKSAIYVIRYSDKQIVAEFVHKCSTTTLCRAVERLAQLYRRCAIIVESNGVGNQVVEYCLEHEFLKQRLFYTKIRKGKKVETHYGWVNTANVRDQVLSCIYSYVSDNVDTLRSSVLSRQLMTLRNRGGKIVGSPDDAVFALGMTLWATKYASDTILRLVGDESKITTPLGGVEELFAYRYSKGEDEMTTIVRDERPNVDLLESFFESFMGSKEIS